MHCIGSLSRGKWDVQAQIASNCALQNASKQNAMIASHDGLPFKFSVHPICGIRDRSLGPWPKNLGRWAAAANRMQPLAYNGRPEKLNRKAPKMAKTHVNKH
jgi:hypothetical protein